MQRGERPYVLPQAALPRCSAVGRPGFCRRALLGLFGGYPVLLFLLCLLLIGVVLTGACGRR